MPRPRTRAGEIGTVRIAILATGHVQAQARMRDELGALRRLKVVRATEREARRALDEQADLIRNASVGPMLTANSTIADAGARIGAVLALRRCDVDVTANPPTVVIAATVTQTRTEGIRRKPAPKRTRQKRRIALPGFAAAAIRRQLTNTGLDAASYLFATTTGRPLSVSNVERLLRTFASDNEAALTTARIEVGEFTTHIFRRTAATLIESVAGITLASRLLGHSNEQVTRASYVVTVELVDPVTAQIMDEALGELF